MGQPPSAAGARLAAVRAALKRLEGVAKTKVFIAATTSEKTLRRQGRPANITYSRYGTLGSLVARKPLFTPKGGSKELRARAFVAAYPEFFALQPNRDTLVYRRSVPRSGKAGYYVRFDHVHDGLPCAGSNLSVLLDAKGRVNGFFANVDPTISVSSVPAVSLAAAKGAALLPGQTLARPARLEYVDLGKGTRLAWRLDVRDSAKKPWRSWIDAQSGKLLHRASRRQGDLGRHEIGLGLEDTLQRRSLPYYYCGCCEKPMDEVFCGEPCSCLSGAPYGPEFDTIWSAAKQVSQYWDTQFGRDGPADTGAYIDINYYPSYSGGAFFDPDGERVGVGQTAVANDIVAHELGHAQMYYDGGPSYVNDSMAVQEGLANILGYAVDQDDWTIGEDASGSFPGNAKSPSAGQCGDPNAEAESFRFWCFDELDIVDNAYPERRRYYNASMIGHAYYLAAVTRMAPPAFCDNDSQCDTGDLLSVGRCVCKDGGDSDACGVLGGKHCVINKNNTTVAFVGRDHAYVPFYQAIRSGGLSGYRRLHEVYPPVHQAACDYDLSLGYPDCDFTGRAITDAFLAAGHWLPEATAVNDPANQYQAFHRPAFLVNVHPEGVCAPQSPRCPEGQTCEGGYCTTENWADMYVSQPPNGPDPGRIMVRRSLNGIEWSSDQSVYFNNIYLLRAGSGISIARNPEVNALPQAVMVFRWAIWPAIWLASATLSATSNPYWTLSAMIFEDTNETPAVAYFNNTVMVFWKSAGSDQLRYGTWGEGFQPMNIPGAQSSAAPTVTVAFGRLWVFFRGTGGVDVSTADYRIYYTSYDGSTWQPVRVVGSVEPEVQPRTAFRPEIVTYGGPYERRVWVLWGRGDNVRMFSFDSPSSGNPPDLGASSMYKSPPVPLQGTTCEDFNDAWISSFKMNDYLRVYYKHAEAQDAWQTAKRGDG